MFVPSNSHTVVLRFQSVQDGRVVAVLGNTADVDGDEEGRLAGDRKWWIGEATEPAFKAANDIEENDMNIKKGQWAIRLKWYSFHGDSTDGAVYKPAGRHICTIPLNCCLYIPSLEWVRKYVLSHEDVEKLQNKWLSAA